MSKATISGEPNAFLIDLTKCTGCRGCMVACKQWNQLPAEETDFFSGEGYQNPKEMSENTYTVIKYREFEKNGHPIFSFYKEMCMHCDDPACVSVCPVHAFHKTPEGPVIYDEKVCIGCRFCMIGCPFEVPKYQWSKKLPVVRKCTGCYSRIKAGLKPACVTACPTAMEYGPRSQMVQIAEERLKRHPDRYINTIYGKDEAGGTSVLYLSSEPYEELRFPSVPERPMPSYTWPALRLVPGIFATVATGLTALTLFNHRKERLELERNKEKEAEQQRTVQAEEDKS